MANLTTVGTFDGVDGFAPNAGLVFDPSGDLFGTAAEGGAAGDTLSPFDPNPGYGTIWELSDFGSSLSSPTVIFAFNSADGANPAYGLTTDSAGDIFGTTSAGGANGYGTSFELVRSPLGDYQLETISNFTSANTPLPPPLEDAAGDVFGTTSQNGENNGTVFEDVNNGDGTYLQQTLMVFGSETDELDPLLVAFDSDGNLIGNTLSSVFELVKSGGDYTFQNIASFGTIGFVVGDLIFDAAGNIFGKTSIAGTIWEIPKVGSGYASTPVVLASFGPQQFPQGLTPDAAGDLFGTTQGAYTIGNGSVFELTDTGFQVACHVTQSRIGTPTGERVVETLAVGDLVLTASGAEKPIVWLGHRHLECRRHPRPADVWPVRVAAGAFGDNTPHRDLWLSPDHAVFVDGVLIPIRHLINDATVTQEPRDEVTYWHIELARHDVLLAEGLSCESYLDTGNRHAFGNGAVETLHPTFGKTADSAWSNNACAPLVESGPRLAAVRARLADRAALLGCPISGVLEIPVDAAGCISAVVPLSVRTVRLISAPVRRGDDRRLLGALVTGLRINGAPIALGDGRLVRGFHGVENHGGKAVRWTDGAGVVSLGSAPNDRLVEIDVAAVSVEPGKQAAA